MFRIRIAQAAAVAAVALTAIVSVPAAAMAATPVGAPAPTVSQESLGWGG
ncbi:hypothetical protein GCM10010495_34010 [Kitasatospora herbaricolor]|nr:hypothetical protein [Kitasatospora herbaricolor]MDQ0307536.1 invasion protein IalB [Kitasatospora herbaricolor]GGV16825.1 hypothetical protein GCM10010495_34010 [Kitasatospora herbaricolor]